jgi:hypothetical protein
MKIKYVKLHNNYDLTLNKTYDGIQHNTNWILINKDDADNTVLYRTECFEKI